jgi:hypothetical protein
MADLYGDYGVDESEDLDLIEIRTGETRVGWAGFAKGSGLVYLGGDLHPLGSYTALLKAAKEHVPYVAVSAVNVLFPADWLRGECLGDVDRQRIIGNLEAYVRGQ